MKKIISIAMLSIAALMLFSACSTAEIDDEQESTPEDTQTTDEETQDSNVIAIVNGEPIYKESYDDAYDYYYNYYVSIYGDDLSIYESEISEAALTAVVNEKIYMDKFSELGYLNYTEEQLADAEAKAQEDIDYYIDLYYSDEIITQLEDDYTDDEYKAAMSKYEEDVLASVLEMTKEEIVDYYLASAAEENAYADIVASVEPTEEDITASYEQILSEYKASVAEDPSLYVSDVNSGYSTYYVPAGVRSVRQVLIKMDQNTIDAITLLRSNGFEDEANILLEQGLESIQESAEDVLSKLENGDITFIEAIDEYNDDTGMPEEGYAVAEGVDNYVEQFTLAAMELAEAGEFTSKLISSDYGYHIIEYYSDIDEGELSLDEVYDEICEELKTSLASEAWSETVAQWEQEAEVEYFLDNI